MNYSINDLAKLANISTRTLRYYDKIGLLSPKRVLNNNCRTYSKEDVDILQQILFFKEIGLPLNEIKKIIYSKDFNVRKALEQHKEILLIKKSKINTLLNTLDKTLKYYKGEIEMNDNEKFEAFKENSIKENQEKYNDELIEKYGKENIEKANKKFYNINKEDWEKQEELSKKIALLLKEALLLNDPSCPKAQEACEAHKKWLLFFWDKKIYSKKAHMALGEMYVNDERFKAYYDKIDPLAANFFCEALKIYCK